MMLRIFWAWALYSPTPGMDCKFDKSVALNYFALCSHNFDIILGKGTIHGFGTPGLQDSQTLGLPNSGTPGLRDSRTPRESLGLEAPSSGESLVQITSKNCQI